MTYYKVVSQQLKSVNSQWSSLYSQYVLEYSTTDWTTPLLGSDLFVFSKRSPNTV